MEEITALRERAYSDDIADAIDGAHAIRRALDLKREHIPAAFSAALHEIAGEAYNRSPEHAQEAFECTLEATELFAGMVLGGDLDLRGNWANAVCNLCSCNLLHPPALPTSDAHRRARSALDKLDLAVRGTPEERVAAAAAGRLGAALVGCSQLGEENADAARRDGISLLRRAHSALADAATLTDDAGLRLERLMHASNLIAALGVDLDTRPALADLAALVVAEIARLNDSGDIEVTLNGERGVDVLARNFGAALRTFAETSEDAGDFSWMRRYTAPVLVGCGRWLSPAASDTHDLLEQIEVGFAYEVILRGIARDDPPGMFAEHLVRLDHPVAREHVVRAIDYLEAELDVGIGHRRAFATEILAGYDAVVAASPEEDDLAELWRLFDGIQDARGFVRDDFERLRSLGEQLLELGDRRRLLIGVALCAAAIADDWREADQRALVSLLEAWMHPPTSPPLEVRWPITLTLRRLARNDPTVHPDIVMHTSALRAAIESDEVDPDFRSLVDEDTFYADLVGTEVWSRGYVAGRSGEDVPTAEMQRLIGNAVRRIRCSSLDREEQDRLVHELERLLILDDFLAGSNRLRAALARGERNVATEDACWTVARAAVLEGFAHNGEHGDVIAAAVQGLVRQASSRPLSETAVLCLPDLIEAPGAALLNLNEHDRLELLRAGAQSPARHALTCAQPLARAAHAVRDLVGSPLWPSAARLQRAVIATALATPDAITAVGPWQAALLLAGCVIDESSVGLDTNLEVIGNVMAAMAAVVASANAPPDQPPDARIFSLYALALSVGMFTAPRERASRIDALWHELLARVEALPPDHPLRPLRGMFERDHWAFCNTAGVLGGDQAYPTRSDNTDPALPPTLQEAYRTTAEAARLRRIEPRASPAFWGEVISLLEERPSGQQGANIVRSLLDAAINAWRAGLELDRAACRELIQCAVGDAGAYDVSATGLALQVLERALLVAVAAHHPGQAREVLVRFRSTFNLAVLRSGSGIEIAEHVDQAGRCAIVDGDIGLGLEIMEAARARTLVALREGAWAVADANPHHRRPELDRALQARIVELGAAALASDQVLDAVEAIGRAVGWAPAVHGLTHDWLSLGAALEPRSPLAHAIDDDGMKALLSDPTVRDFQRIASADRVLVWCLGTGLTRVSAGVLPDGTLFATEEAKTAGEDEHGAAVWRLVRWRAPNAKLYVVDCSNDPTAAHELSLAIAAARSAASACLPKGALGSSEASPRRPPEAVAVVPSVRFIAQKPRHESRAAVVERNTVTVLADPRRNLPNSWLEAATWTSRRDLHVKVLIGAAATCKALRQALETSDTVVVCCHGVTSDTEGAVIELSDGAVRFASLGNLTDRLCTRRLLLSSCWGGGTTRGRLRRESMGLTTALLAQGIDEIAAPIDAVDDLPAAIIGSIIASEWTRDTSFAELFGQARERLARSGTDLPYRDHARHLLNPDFAWACQLADPPIAAVRTRVEQVSAADVRRTLDAYAVFGS